MEYIRYNPTLWLVGVISIVIILISVMIYILYLKFESEKSVSRAALEIKRITNSMRAGLVNFSLEDDCRILYASKGFYSMLGYTKEEAKAQAKTKILDFVLPKDLLLFESYKNMWVDESIKFDVKMLNQNGDTLSVLVNGNNVLEKDGRHTISAVFVDISEQKLLQETILLEGERYRIAAELSNDVLFEYDIKMDEMRFTDKYRDLFGRNPISTQYLYTIKLRKDMIHPNDWGIYVEFNRTLTEGKDLIEAEFRIKDRMGEFVWCQIKGKTIFDDNKMPLRVVGKLVNVDLHKKEIETLEYKATRDPLTGVYNKMVTIKKIDKFISGNGNSKHVLLIVDIDDFKKINDTFGHLQGDKVLIHVIEGIKEVFSAGEIIGRIGGDEFIVFAGNVSDTNDILAKAGLLNSILDTTYACSPHKIPMSISIGIAICPENGMHYEQLLECADKALYIVKEHGKSNYMLYSKAI